MKLLHLLPALLHRIRFHLPSVASSGNETLHFSAPDDWQVIPKSLIVKQGQQDIRLHLLAPEGLGEDAAHVEILIEGRDRLEVSLKR